MTSQSSRTCWGRGGRCGGVGARGRAPCAEASSTAQRVMLRSMQGEGEERAGVADRLLAVSRQRRSLADSSAPPTRPQTPGPPSLLAVTEAAEDGLPWGAAASRPESRNFRSLLRRCYRLLSRLPIVGPAWRATVRMAIAFSRAVARTAYSVGALRVLGFCAEAFLMAATVTAGETSSWQCSALLHARVRLCDTCHAFPLLAGVQAALRACPAALAEVSRCLGNGGGELKGRLAQGLLHAGCLIGMYALTRLGVALVRRVAAPAPRLRRKSGCWCCHEPRTSHVPALPAGTPAPAVRVRGATRSRRRTPPRLPSTRWPGRCPGTGACCRRPRS